MRNEHVRRLSSYFDLHEFYIKSFLLIVEGQDNGQATVDMLEWSPHEWQEYHDLHEENDDERFD